VGGVVLLKKRLGLLCPGGAHA